jgi:hypothetical protein
VRGGSIGNVVTIRLGRGSEFDWQEGNFRNPCALLPRVRHMATVQQRSTDDIGIKSPYNTPFTIT